jgi:hypothetical protein
MGELISERIKRNARELQRYGLADTADELVDRADAGKLGYREFLDRPRIRSRGPRGPPLPIAAEAFRTAVPQDPR